MKAQRTSKGSGAFYVAKLGRVSVSVYRRTMPNGAPGFLVANYSTGKRRLDSYATEQDAKTAAQVLARRLSTGDTLAAGMRSKDAASYGRAVDLLRETGVPLELACAHFAEAWKILGGDHVVAAARLYVERNPAALPTKSVPDLVKELIAHKEKRKASPRYVEDLRSRLTRFADAHKVPIASVTAANVTAYLDSLKVSPQTVANTRRVLSLLFSFAVARGFLRKADNPIEHVEKVSVRSSGNVEILKPAEVGKLLEAASEDFRPCLALAAFAGLRSAEVERLSWEDVDLKRGFVTVAAHKSKTGSRRLVPISANLRAWLAEAPDRKGPVWKGDHKGFYDAQAATAEAAGLKWKANALRHSFASYRLAEVQSAAQVSLECGNSPAVVFKHYRELCTPTEASAWFAVSPAVPANVSPLPVASAQ